MSPLRWALKRPPDLCQQREVKHGLCLKLGTVRRDRWDFSFTFVFVFAFYCICICVIVFVFVELYLCNCNCIWSLVSQVWNSQEDFEQKILVKLTHICCFVSLSQKRIWCSRLKLIHWRWSGAPCWRENSEKSAQWGLCDIDLLSQVWRSFQPMPIFNFFIMKPRCITSYHFPGSFASSPPTRPWWQQRRSAGNWSDKNSLVFSSSPL